MDTLERLRKRRLMLVWVEAFALGFITGAVVLALAMGGAF